MSNALLRSNKNALKIGFWSHLLGDFIRNEVINFYKKQDLLAKGFFTSYFDLFVSELI